MALKLMTALAMIVSVPGVATAQAATAYGAPQAAPSALYCLKMEPMTGTRIPTVMCQTREQWFDDEINIDEVWAEDGVRVIG